MVLEEATSSTEPTTTFSSTTSDTPTSDIDPYSSNTPSSTSPILQIQQENAEPLYVDTSTLPKPFALFGFVEAQNNRNIANGIYATCTYASKVLQRPLRQEEADAFAFHWAKSMKTASYGTPVGVSIAMLWAYRHSDYRFPLWKPMKAGSPFSPDRLGPLRGSAARAAWNFGRYNAYGAVGMVFGQLFFASYALTLHAASRALDPRLGEFTEALKQRQKEGMNRAKEIREQRMGESRQEGQGETFEMARQRRTAMQQRQRSRIKGGDDDMSPTGGSFAEDFMEDAGQDVGARVEAMGREQQGRSESNAAAAYDAFASSGISGSSESSPTITRDASLQQAQPRTQSPQQSPQQQQQQQQPPRSSGSAWERLRQNAMSGQPVNPSPATPRGSTSVNAGSRNDFSFSNSEEDRQLAKGEAQREFDKRIEREREGRDFGR